MVLEDAVSDHLLDKDIASIVIAEGQLCVPSPHLSASQLFRLFALVVLP